MIQTKTVAKESPKQKVPPVLFGDVHMSHVACYPKGLDILLGTADKSPVLITGMGDLLETRG
jgi:hypothetical protein